MSELFVVSTPIGNLGDITIRALEILKDSDVILCEDTRITSRLLIKYDIKNKKLVIYNDQNSNDKLRKTILDMINSGLKVTLVSDAGTPLISDPGHKLVELLVKNNIKVTPIPGASSVISALSVCGLKVENFAFLGFSPSSKQQRVNFLKNAPKDLTFVFFEGVSRVFECLNDISEVLGSRKVAIVKELTKINEEVISDDINEVIQYFKENSDKLRGEFVIIIEKIDKNDRISDENLKNEIKMMIDKGFSLKDLSKDLAEIHDLNKKKVYNLALEMIK